MRRWGPPALRLSLGIIFVWFGLLKPLGLSPAAPLVKATVFFHEGEKVSCLYILVEGQVKIAQTTAEGHQVILRTIAPGHRRLQPHRSSTFRIDLSAVFAL